MKTLETQSADARAEILIQNCMINSARKSASRLMVQNSALLNALEDVLRYCVTVRGMKDKGKGRTREQQTALDNATAAIALVTRETTGQDSAIAPG